VVGRLEAAVWFYVLFALGVFLLVAPWSPLWDRAFELAARSELGSWVLGGAARGATSALGLLDLVGAAAEMRALWPLLGRASSE